MAGRSNTRYSTEQNSMWQFDILVILADAERYMTIDEIQAESINMRGLSHQKMARLISKLVEIGSVIKAKDRESGKMVYKARGVD